MAGKRNLRQRVASVFELPGDVLMDVARVTLVGDVELMIENHRGLVEYTQTKVVLNVPKGQLAVSGDELEIATITPDQVIVLGRVRGVHYID